MGELIDGVELHVCASAPKNATRQLKEFRILLPRKRTATTRRRYESELEKFLQSAPYLRGAAWRYLTPRAAVALQRSAKAIKQADRILSSMKKHRAQTQ